MGTVFQAAMLKESSESWRFDAIQDVTRSITTFLVDVDDYPAYASVRSKRFLNPGPASSTVFVKGLVNPKYLIEIEAIAVAS